MSRDLKVIQGLSSELAKGVLKEIAPATLKRFDRVEKSVFKGTYGLPEDLEFAAAILQAVAYTLIEMQDRRVLSAATPESLAKLMVKEVLERIRKRKEGTKPEDVRAGFEAFFGQSPSIIDQILGFFLSSIKTKGGELDPLSRLKQGVLKIVDRQGRISTGFVLSDRGHVLTAEHVAHGHDRMKIAFRYRIASGERRELEGWTEVIHADRERDIAVLRVLQADWQQFKEVRIDPLPISLRWQPRNRVLCLGYQEQEIFADPISVEAFIKPHDPILAVRFRDGSEQDCLVLVIPQDHPSIVPGMSGGPVLNLDTGKVMAMVTGATREAWVRQKWRDEEIWELISSGVYGFTVPLSDVAVSWPEFKKCCPMKSISQGGVPGVR